MHADALHISWSAVTLAVTAADLRRAVQVGANIAIARDTKHKQALVALLEVLLKLQQASNLQRALK